MRITLFIILLIAVVRTVSAQPIRANSITTNAPAAATNVVCGIATNAIAGSGISVVTASNFPDTTKVFVTGAISGVNGLYNQKENDGTNFYFTNGVYGFAVSSGTPPVNTGNSEQVDLTNASGSIVYLATAEGTYGTPWTLFRNQAWYTNNMVLTPVGITALFGTNYVTNITVIASTHSTNIIADFTQKKITNAPNVIVDTGMEQTYRPLDIDFLCRLADRGELNILAVTCANTNWQSIQSLSATMDFWGYGNIPIAKATNASSFAYADGLYGSYIATNYANTLLDTNAVPTATTTVRKILAGRGSKDVTLIYLGRLRNLLDLYNSPADSISGLTGLSLITNKVTKIVISAGDFPDQGFSLFQGEINLQNDTNAAVIITSLTNLISTTITWCGGNNFNAVNITNVENRTTADPSRDANPGNNSNGWGVTALLAAARGYTNYDGVAIFTKITGYTRWDQATQFNFWTNSSSYNEEFLAPTPSSISDYSVGAAGSKKISDAINAVLAGAVVRHYRKGPNNGTFLSVPKGGVTWSTNATAPADGTTIKVWLTVTNDLGKVGKIPVYY